jgi:DNA modification methylase
MAGNLGRQNHNSPSWRPQLFENGEIHDWYRFTLGYSDKFVSGVLSDFNLRNGQLVVDPFCGSGTTLVECMKTGVTSIGFDASPFACFAARIKTNIRLDPNSLARSLVLAERTFTKSHRQDVSRDPTYVYIHQCGMIERGWISDQPLSEAIRLRRAIDGAAVDSHSRDALLLALAALLPTEIGNMKFGPTIYTGTQKKTVDVWPLFRSRVKSMIADIAIYKAANPAASHVVRGDVRKPHVLERTLNPASVSLAITSPPYPTEHDYTRHTRLELIFLGFVNSNDDLRAIKKTMIRSHTKGVYKNDQDFSEVDSVESVQRLARRIEILGKEKTDGFARLYPRLVKSYFGGMKRHLVAFRPYLKPNAKYVMLIGDQASYHGVRVPTADLVGQLANDVGYEVEDVKIWRQRWATKQSKTVAEKALILRRKGR